MVCARACLLSVLLACTVCACSPKAPIDVPAIESVGLLAIHARKPEALAQLRRWSDQNFAVAQRELALALLRDSSTRAEGLSWMQRAAQNGDAEAAFVLGEAQRVGSHGLKADAFVARPWLQQAANAGHADAALALARMARNGDAGPRDALVAVHWLQIASERGAAQAMFLLSNAYADGEGAPVDLDKARKWLEAAADKHFTPAIQAYALALENGSLGFEKDPVLARELFAEASEERRNHWNTR